MNDLTSIVDSTQNIGIMDLIVDRMFLVRNLHKFRFDLPFQCLVSFGVRLLLGGVFHICHIKRNPRSDN